MTSITGNNGFTFIEVMVATCILALGTVLVYQAFFITLDSYSYCLDYLKVASFADEELWKAQDSLTRSGSLDVPTQGYIASENKHFYWRLSDKLIDEKKGAYKLFETDFVVSWRRGNRNFDLQRTAYARYENE